MPGIFEGYSYDIFISYRQKDNKGDRWVSEFVEALKTELESTFKEEISVYFDINPHDGLLEIHDVSASLKEKLKCLIFIPILSRTYCDPKSFAWEYEFKAFVDQASHDQFGLRVKLPDGNIAARVLPVRIHELDQEDADLCGSVLGGFLRGIEFIYKEPGVNRPLTPYDDENKNLNKTRYRNQINKVANAVKEIISGLKELKAQVDSKKTDARLPWEETGKEKMTITPQKKAGLKKKILIPGIVSTVILIVILLITVFPELFRKSWIDKLISKGEKVSVAVFPFRDLASDSAMIAWPEALQLGLITCLSSTEEFVVRDDETITGFIQNSGIADNAHITSSQAGMISSKLETDIYIYGTIQKTGGFVQTTVQITDTKTKEIIESFQVNLPYSDHVIFRLTDSVSSRVVDFLNLIKLIRGNLKEISEYSENQLTKSPEALTYFLSGLAEQKKGRFGSVRSLFENALRLDSSFHLAAFEREGASNLLDDKYWWKTRNFRIRDQMPPVLKYQVSWAYASSFESYEKQLEYLALLEEVTGRTRFLLYFKAVTYVQMNKPLEAIPLFEELLKKVRRLEGKEALTKVPDIYKQLSGQYGKTGNVKKALKVLKTVMRKCPEAPEYSEFILFKAGYLYRLNRPDAGSRCFKEYVAYCRNKGKYSEADEMEDKGWLYFIRKMSDSAQVCVRKSIEMEAPGYDQARLNRVTILMLNYSVPDLDDYLKYMDLLIAPSLKKRDKYQYFRLMSRKGRGYLVKGRYDEALEIFQNVYDESPYKLYYMKQNLEEVRKAMAEKNVN